MKTNATESRLVFDKSAVSSLQWSQFGSHDSLLYGVRFASVTCIELNEVIVLICEVTCQLVLSGAQLKVSAAWQCLVHEKSCL